MAGMNRRVFLSTIGIAVLAPLAAEAQPATDVERRRNAKLPVIGYLGSGYPSDRSSSRFAYLFESFADGLRQLGYVDGQTVKTEWRWAEEQYGRLPDLPLTSCGLVLTSFSRRLITRRSLPGKRLIRPPSSFWGWSTL
jgi:hypothetical protein